MLVSGADWPRPKPAQPRRQTDVQRTGQLMYELSRLYPDDLGRACRRTAGRCRWRTAPMADSTSARIATSRTSFSRSARRTIPRARFSPAASCCGTCRARRPADDEHFGFARALVRLRSSVQRWNCGPLGSRQRRTSTSSPSRRGSGGGACDHGAVQGDHVQSRRIASAGSIQSQGGVPLRQCASAPFSVTRMGRRPSLPVPGLRVHAQ